MLSNFATVVSIMGFADPLKSKLSTSSALQPLDSAPFESSFPVVNMVWAIVRNSGCANKYQSKLVPSLALISKRERGKTQSYIWISRTQSDECVFRMFAFRTALGTQTLVVALHTFIDKSDCVLFAFRTYLRNCSGSLRILGLVTRKLNIQIDRMTFP